jgi:hypothetical protein
MSRATPRVPLESFQVLSVMQPAARAVWEKFLAEIGDETLTAEDAWLLLQFAEGSAKRPDLNQALGLLLDEPAREVQRGLARGWITKAVQDEELFVLTEVGRHMLTPLFPVAQAFNAAWRAEIFARGVSPQQLDLVLTMLQGKTVHG